MLVAMPQGEPIDEHGTRVPTTGVDQPFGRCLAVTVEDALELRIQILNRLRAQFVEDPADLDPVIGVRAGPAAGGRD